MEARRDPARDDSRSPASAKEARAAISGDVKVGGRVGLLGTRTTEARAEGEGGKKPASPRSMISV